MFDRLQVVFKSLNSHDVKYLVIGGMAAIAHGSTRNTFDLDLLIEPSVENAKRLLDAFLEVNFGTAALITPEDLARNEITIFKDRVKIDVQTTTPGLDFNSSWKHRKVMQASGIAINVLSRDDLLASKRAAGRPKDLQDIEALRDVPEARG
jgi:predicted nucleotidyltransferase